jgi:hypothetical protein
LAPTLERRRVAHPKAQGHTDFQSELKQGFLTDEMGAMIYLRCKNPELLMSALDHKRT